MKQLLEVEKGAEEDKRKLALELEKEREAWKIQYEEIQFKEAQTLQTRQQELMAQIEKQKLEQELQIQKQRIELERLRIEMEDRIKLKETEFKQELQRSKGNHQMGDEVSPKLKTVKLRKLDFQKFTGDILKWKKFIDCFTGAFDQNLHFPIWINLITTKRNWKAKLFLRLQVLN